MSNHSIILKLVTIGGRRKTFGKKFSPMGYLCLSVSMPAYTTPPNRSFMMLARASALSMPCRAPTNTVFLGSASERGNSHSYCPKSPKGSPVPEGPRNDRSALLSNIKKTTRYFTIYMQILSHLKSKTILEAGQQALFTHTVTFFGTTVKSPQHALPRPSAHVRKCDKLTSLQRILLLDILK